MSTSMSRSTIPNYGGPMESENHSFMTLLCKFRLLKTKLLILERYLMVSEALNLIKKTKSSQSWSTDIQFMPKEPTMCQWICFTLASLTRIISLQTLSKSFCKMQLTLTLTWSDFGVEDNINRMNFLNQPPERESWFSMISCSVIVSILRLKNS